ncbi:MAG: hypothetical protein ABIK15_18920 [Pseudomonadota bacterium]
MHINGMGMMMTNGMGMRPSMHPIEKSTPDFEAIAAKKLEQKDTDDSGGLTIDEVNLSEEALVAADADANGELNSDELIEYETKRYSSLYSKQAYTMQGFHAIGRPPFGTDTKELTSTIVEEMDADENGTLSSSEIDISEEVFAGIDSDEDAELSSDELTNSGSILHDALHAKRLMEDHDENGDGVLTDDELDISTDVFGEIDTDSDGTLSRAEIEAGIQQLRPEKSFGQGSDNMMMPGIGFGRPPLETDTEELISTLIEGMDADENGTLSSSEIDISEEAFAGIDSDEDAELSSDELTNSGSILHDALHAQRLMEDHDENGDGVLTDDELDISTDVFGEIDTDSDGTLSRAEVEAGIQQLDPRESALRSRDIMMMPGMGFGSGSQFMGLMSGASMYSMVSDSYFNSFGNANMPGFGLFA